MGSISASPDPRCLGVTGGAGDLQGIEVSGAYNDETLLEVLGVLNGFEQHPVLLIWITLARHAARLATRRKPALNEDFTRIEHN